MENVKRRMELERATRSFQDLIQQQQNEINELKMQIKNVSALPVNLYDALDLVASGCGAMQNRLGEVHQQRPDGELRYDGL